MPFYHSEGRLRRESSSAEGRYVFMSVESLEEELATPEEQEGGEVSEMRGVRENAPLTQTTFWRGHYENDPALRTEFFTAVGVRP